MHRPCSTGEMTNASRRLKAALLLASAALVTAVLGYALLIFGTSFAVAFPLRIVSAIAAAAFLASAAALLLRRKRPHARLAPWIFAASGTLAAVAQVLFGLSFGAGMDDADAGRPLGLFASVTWLIALVGVLLIAVAATALTIALLPRAPRLSDGTRGAIAAGVAVVASVPAFLGLLHPTAMAFLALALLAVLIRLATSEAAERDRAVAGPGAPGSSPARADHDGSGVADSGGRASTGAAAGMGGMGGMGASADAGVGAATRKPDTGASFRHSTAARWTGAISLVILALVWGGGAAVGTALAGMTAATTAMGVSAGAAPLAALPLLLGIALVLRSRAPRNRLAFAAIPLVGIGTGVFVQLAFLSTDGTAMFVSSGIAGLSLGIWFGVLLLPRFPRDAVVRAVSFGAITLGGLFVWFSAVPATGGIALAIPALVLLIAGPSLARVRPASDAPARTA